MPKKKQRGGYARKRNQNQTATAKPTAKKAQAARKAKGKSSKGVRSPRSLEAAENGRKSAWASELTAELKKRFNPGQEFSLADVYKLIPAFQRRHKENNHVAARLRTTLAQDLRGQGIVKQAGKQRGIYRMA